MSTTIDTSPITSAINDNMGLFIIGGLLLVGVVGLGVGLRMLGKLSRGF